ncbi:NAD(P)/FAD-dependent oxidoreductase [Segetibacter aerophilus]|uniref:Flavoprotein n=1 Tax=Segetibacter aerophilus TaxID=670293 RepID=A0A512B7E7_9BACT|nr:NAD(P)/FAD-dependent oxidoreductase [Segetibacter aerophilus]GEO07878.1 flavoprotein [Segetibacter aerophilus]
MSKLIVIGGGAAGFFCAINAARLNPSLQVTIVEKTSKLLAKVRVSGGGRCNVTHACFQIPALVKKYPRGTNLLKKSFHQFNTAHCVSWFEERGVKLKTEADNRMFSITDSSQTIIDCLLREASKYKVEILMNREVKQLARVNDEWQLVCSDNSLITADYVCVACGGYPKSAMFEWLTRLGHSIEEPVPSLFTFNIPNNPITKLMGVSVEQATVKIVGSKLSDEGPLLVTHWGMSGPAILKLSAWGARELANKNYHFNILVNWLSSYNEQTLRDQWQLLRNEKSAQKIGNRNPFNLPSRLWIYLLNESGINEEIRWADLPGKEQNKLIKNLTAQEFEVKGKTTFKEEFVTCGGIKLSEVDANTMQSKIVPNVYFAGEILDVDGITGGFNFQHAWTSGWIAAKAIAEPE